MMRARSIPVTLVALVLALGLLLGGCSLRTTGVDADGTTITARFDDILNLVVGHAVRVSDVQIGTVTAVSLTDDFKADVTMVIDHDRPVPEGTIAVISKTSLLGENFVALQFPDEAAPPIADGGAITDTIVLPELEQISQQAIEVLGAIVSADLDTIVDTAVTAVGGRGDELNTLVVDLGSVVEVYAGRTDDIGAIIDGFGALGAHLAAGAGSVDAMIGDLDEATAAVAGQRSRIVSTLEELTGLAAVLNDQVLIPHSTQLTRSLEQLDPVVRTLANETGRLETLLDDLLLFSRNVKRAVVGGHAQVYGLITQEPGGGPGGFPLLQLLEPPR